jgi:hypothetical protein
VTSADRDAGIARNTLAVTPFVSFDDPQSSQQLIKIDGPTDPHPLGREQTAIFPIPKAFVPIPPIPIDRHPREGPLRTLIRIYLQIAHDDAPGKPLILY